MTLPAQAAIVRLGGIHSWGSETPYDQQHREKFSDQVPLLKLLVARMIPAGSAEFKSTLCQAALRSEIERLVKAEVWSYDSVREWKDDVQDPSEKHATVARLFAIMGRKISEYEHLLPGGPGFGFISCMSLKGPGCARRK